MKIQPLNLCKKTDFAWGPTSHFSGIKTKVGTESEVKKIEFQKIELSRFLSRHPHAHFSAYQEECHKIHSNIPGSL